MIDKKFEFPPLFIEFSKYGWLNSENDNYLWLDDMEWLDIQEIYEYEYENGEIRNIVPFAVTGGGDKWIWYIEDDKITSVGLVYHDDINGKFYSENLEGAIFRNILEFVSDSCFYIDEDDAESYQISIDELRALLSDWINKLRGFFQEAWVRELEKLQSLDFKYCHTDYGDYYALLTPKEAKDKIKHYLDFNLLDKTFKWDTNVY